MDDESPVLADIPPGPNPRIYECREGVNAFPTMASRRQTARELSYFADSGLEVISAGVPAEGPSEDGIKRVRQRFAGGECLFAVTADDVIHFIPRFHAGRPLTHAMAAGGRDVIAAGVMTFGLDGRPLTWNNRSGHYRPTQDQNDIIVRLVLRETGLMEW